MLEFVLNFLFPPVCGVCGKLNRNWICVDCENRLNKFEQSKILCFSKKKIKYKKVRIKFINNKILIINNFLINRIIASKTFVLSHKSFSKEKHYRRNLLSNIFYYDKLLYIYRYEKIVRKLILQYKFFDKPYLSNMFSKIILKNKKICRILKLYDIIIPVPMNKNKKIRRGYNQTELIAKELSKKLEIKIEIDLLRKVKQTKTQSKLKEKERKNNVKDAFCVYKKNCFKGKKIILLDDIYTTGSTVNEISKILKNNGAIEILVLVIAKD